MPRPQHIRFPGAQGQILAGILDLPDSPPVAHAVFAHCFTCTKDLKAAHFIGQVLAAEGVALLRFDFAGLGQSEGYFTSTTLSSNIKDVVATAGYLRGAGRPPQLLIGHSLGGAAVLAAAASIPEIRAVCTIAAPFRPRYLSA